jgi:hypothetical protein
VRRRLLELGAAAGRGEAREQLAAQLVAVEHLDPARGEAAPVAHARDAQERRPIGGRRPQEVGVQRVQRELGRARGGERRAAERHGAEAGKQRVEAILAGGLEDHRFSSESMWGGFGFDMGFVGGLARRA